MNLLMQSDSGEKSIFWMGDSISHCKKRLIRTWVQL